MLAVAATQIWNARRCPLCGGEGWTRFRLPTYRINRCRSCAAEFNASFDGGGQAGELFDRTYYEVRHKEAFAAGLEDYHADQSLPVFRRRLEQIEARTGVGTILDVGPGLGTFLRLAHEAGWKSEGVEVSAFAADFIRRTHGLSVFTGDLTRFAPITSTRFDAITFWDSIEHVSEPVSVLRTAAHLLRPGGVLLITTDNFDCLVADIAVAAYRLTGGRVSYPVERVFIDRNRTFFTERSLRDLLRQLGLDVVFFEKMEYPISKIKTTMVERLALWAIYGVAHLVRRQAQVTLLAVRT